MRSGSRHRGEAGGGWLFGFPPLLATDGRIHKGDCDMRTGAIFARGSCRALKWMAVLGVLSLLGSVQVAAQAPTVESATYATNTVTVTMSSAVRVSSGTATDLAFGAFAIAGNATTAHAVDATNAGATTFTVTFTTNLAGISTQMTYNAPVSGARIVDATSGDPVASFTVTVLPATALLPLIDNMMVERNSTVSIVLPEGVGGTDDLTYSLTPAGGAANDPPLTGLTFAPDTRTIAGTPTDPVGTRIQLTYGATDGTNAADGVQFYLEVSAAPTRIDTTGEVTGISVDGAEEVTIDGEKRLHVNEGDFTEVEVEVTWTNAQLTQLWETKTGDKPAPAMVMVEATAVAGTGSAAEWLSPAEIGHDVVLGSGTIEVAIPAAPKTQKDSTRVDVKGMGKTTLTLGPDTDAEEDGFTLAATGMAPGAMDDAETRTIVIVDDEAQGVKLTRTTKGNIFEGGSDIVFTATPDPPRVDLDLKVRYDLTDVAGQSVSSRLYSVDSADGIIGTGAGAKDTVTLNLAPNDGDRMDDALQMHAEVVSYDLASGAFDDIGTAIVDFTVIDVHKLPPLMVSPATGTVAEGGMIELTLTIDRNPANTIVTDDEKRQQTAEAIEVMLTAGAGSTAGMSDYDLPATVEFEKHNGKAPWTQEMMVEVMATEDDELDPMEMLVLDAMVAGTVAANGSEKDSHAGVSMLTIEEGTMKYVSPKTDEEIQAVIYPAKEAGMGADMIFSPGEMIEVAPASALFNAAEGVTLSYSAMSDHDHVATTTVSGSTVTVTAGDETGMAHITITAHASMPSGAKGLPQTDPREASIIFPVEVGLETLSFTLMGPEDMNLVEGTMMGGMVTATANRAVTADVTINLMRDRAMSSADDMDYTAEAITIAAGMMSGTTMVMAVEDDMMENMDNMPEELVLYGMAADNAGEVMGEVKFYIWDAAVPALPIIAQLLLAAFLAFGGYRRYRRR